MNYGLNQVIGENETGFRGQADVLYRTEGWDFLLAGGALYNNLDYSFTAEHPRGTLREYKSPGGGSIELRRQLGILKRFLDELPLVRMKPDATVVRRVSPELKYQALVEPGRAYAIYLHVPLPNKPKDLPSLLRTDILADVSLELPPGQYVAEWIDTKTGQVQQRQTLHHSGGSQLFRSPSFANDIALRLIGNDSAETSVQ